MYIPLCMSSYICMITIVHYLQLEKKAQIHFNLRTSWGFGCCFLFLSPLGKGETKLLVSIENK